MTSIEAKYATPNALRERELSYIYLCSPPHSGSTLVACLAAAHPDISTVGELGGVFKQTSRCSCGQTYSGCNYWQNLVQLAASNGIAFVPGAADMWIGPTSGGSRGQALLCHFFRWKLLDRLRDVVFHAASEYRAAQRAATKSVRVARLLCEHEGTTAFLDTTKNAYRMRHLLDQREMPVKVIALSRDGRGTVQSLMKWYGRTLPEAVSEWLWSIRNMRRALRYVPAERVLSLRLEDLSHAPEVHMPRLFTYCGVDPDSLLDFSGQERHIAGNAMRLQFDGTIRNEESWRQRLTQAELDYFQSRAGDVNRSLGYVD